MTPNESVTSIKPVTSTVTDVTDVTDSRQAATACEHCGEPILSPADATPGTHLHAWCATWATSAPVAEPLPAPEGWPALPYKRQPLEPPN